MRGDHEHCRHYFREFRDAGYNIVYGFFELYPSDFWSVLIARFAAKVARLTPDVPRPKSPTETSSYLLTAASPNARGSGQDLTVGPNYTPNYYEHLADYLREAAAHGLKVAHCVSALVDPLGSQSARREHMRRLADVHHQVGLDAIAWVNVNEPTNIGADGPDEVIDFMNAYREATAGRVLTFHGSTQDESVETIGAFARNASGFEEHTFRGGDADDKIRHIFSLLYEQRLHESVRNNGIFSEGPGPLDPVSVGQENNAEAVALLRVMEACTHSPSFAFSGKGLWSKHHGDTFHNVPAFGVIPKLIAKLEAFAPHLHTFEILAHTGEGGPAARHRVLDLPDNDEEVRLDQFISPSRRQAVCIVYADRPRSVRISNLVGGNVRVLHPQTAEDLGFNGQVDFERGRVFLVSW